MKSTIRTVMTVLLLVGSLAPCATASELLRERLLSRDPASPSLGAAPLEAPCDAVLGTGHTWAIGPGQFQGEVADLTIGGEARPASVTVTVLDMVFTVDGTIQATTAHVYEVDADGDGSCEPDESCFETLDHTVLSPSDTTPGLFRMNEVNRLSGGHGDFEGATGHLVTHGWIDLVGGTADWQVRGRICR